MTREHTVQTPTTQYEKKEFLSIVAHELRNPLATILSSIELLRMQGNYTFEQSALLGTIEERVSAMSQTLTKLLDTVPVHTVSPSPRAPMPTLARAILLVDDNILAACALEQLLVARGHVVTVAHTGVEAVRLARAEKPEIIILDIGLPDISGYDVLHILQAEEKFHPHFVALTGYGNTDDKIVARDRGFDAHITKPARIEDITLALDALTSRQSE